MRIELSLCGSSQLVRAICECGISWIVTDPQPGEKVTHCGKSAKIPMAFRPKAITRVAGGTRKRKQPSSRRKMELLIEQDNRCAYCDCEFGSFVVYKRKVKQALCEFDHVIPRSHTESDSDDNFVAACSICNRLKSNLRFSDYESMVGYILRRRSATVSPIDSPEPTYVSPPF